jgi:carboxypeptidase T
VPRYRISIKSHDREAMLDLVRTHKVSVYDHGSKRSPSGEYSVDATADAAEIRKLRAAGYHVDRHEDIDKVGRARQREVGQGNRYRDRDDGTGDDRRDGQD